MLDVQEVLGIEDAAWAELGSTIGRVSAERVEVEGVVPGWSTHDVVWHTAYWVGYGADAIDSIRQGQPEPADDDATETDNDAIAEIGRTMTWQEVLDRLDQHRAAARAALGAFDGVVPQRAIEFFADYTTGHYVEHEPQIRAFAEAQ